MTDKHKKGTVMIDFSKMEGHTPGPWSEGLIMPDYNDETKMICDDVSGPSGETICRLFDGGERQYQNSAANSYLIAAAPAMKDEIIRQQAEDQYKQAVINDISRDNDRLRAVIDELVEALECARDTISDLVCGYSPDSYTSEHLGTIDVLIEKARGNGRNSYESRNER